MIHHHNVLKIKVLLLLMFIKLLYAKILCIVLLSIDHVHFGLKELMKLKCVEDQKYLFMVVNVVQMEIGLNLL